MKYTVKDKPVWEIEVICAIASYFDNIEEKIIENYDKYGVSKETMRRFLEKYIKYKDAVLNEIMPIFNEKYKELESYFLKDSNDLNNPLIVELVKQHMDIFNKNISDKDIDEMLSKIIDEILFDSLGDDGTSYNYNNLPDIILLLNKTQLSNNVKMNIINFYINRYHLSRRIVDLIEEVTPICEKYFSIIEDEYKMSYDNLCDADNLNKLIKKYTNLDVNNTDNLELYIYIFFLGQLSIVLYGEENKVFVGYKSIELLEIMNNTEYVDTQMISMLKSVADVTRYKILNMLSEKSMYMQEIADKLGLTAANVSHHINTLLQNNVITAFLDSEKNKRIYYELNKSELRNLINILSRIIEE